MFDFTSSKLLILGIVALIVIGPKDLPALLRTIGKYVGIIKRQAAEFRAQFDEAMRESELQQLKRDVESIQQETETAMRDAERTVEQEMAEARGGVDAAMAQVDADAAAPRADALPAPEAAESGAANKLNGASHPAEPSPAGGTDSTTTDTASAPARTSEKSGV
jgi:sec-independent protein translocase protein TatB